jgi:hypothetical protein
MLRTVLQITGLARALGDLKFRLEARAERAVSQVKSIAIRIAVAVALAIAAVIFTLLALITGLVILYAYLEPIYGVTTALAIIGGSLMAVALICVLAAALVGRGKSKPKPAETNIEWQDEGADDWRRESERVVPRHGAAARRARETDAVDSLVSLASLAQRRDRRALEDRVSSDALGLVQSGDRGTMIAVLSAVAAIGWLMGRTMPSAARR